MFVGNVLFLIARIGVQVMRCEDTVATQLMAMAFVKAGFEMLSRQGLAVMKLIWRPLPPGMNLIPPV